jgi:hypothetical protein
MTLDAAIAAFLDLAKKDKLERTLRAQTMLERERYWRGKQYEARELDVNGYRKGSPGVYGSAARTPAWNERDPGACWNIRGEVVGELTDWTLGGDSWCRLVVEDDLAAEDWLTTIATQTNLGDIVAQARDYGGAMGTAVVSFKVSQGEYMLEAHNPRLCWPLAWRDPARHRPAAVGMVYRGDNPFAESDDDLPLLARVWTEQDEALYRRERAPEGSQEKWQWFEVERVVHSLGFCPVVWHPQCSTNGSHDGEPDGEGTEGLVDDANELTAAASCTTKRNAEDTLVVQEDPSLNPGNVRKGGFNTIFARGGAQYLSQDGASAKICEELAERRAQRVYRLSGVVMVDLETLGKATTGEALKRLFQRTLKTAGALRRDYAKGLIVPLAQLLLQSARKLRQRGLTLVVPPKVTRDDVLGAKVQAARDPGKSNFVSCAWPETFPPTLDDLQKLVTSARTGAGDKQVLSRKTAVTWIAGSPIPISNVDQELKAIEDDEAAAAEKAAASIGLGAEPEGKAGPVGDKGEGDDDKNDGQEADDKETKAA